jgi:hypothetical protein
MDDVHQTMQDIAAFDADFQAEEFDAQMDV